jgi:hypothetical protein
MAQQSWTNDPITAGQNRIRKKPIHFTELQDAINAWEAAYSIENTSFTDSPATGIKITSTVIIEMQDALDALYQLADSSDFSWTEASTPKTIKPAHMNELRDNMNIMQNDYCYQCDSCDTEATCDCDPACYNDACTNCHASRHGYSGCVGCNGGCYANCGPKYSGCSVCATCNTYHKCNCDPACYNDACTNCDARCHTDECVQCDGVAYRYPWS